MNIYKTVLSGAGIASVAMIFGGALQWSTGDQNSLAPPKLLIGNGAKPIRPQPNAAMANTSSNADLALADTDPKTLSPNEPNPAPAGKLPGVFRGDWGETPIYAANDRVNYAGSAYLSLQAENQNQVPDSSPNYWRWLKTYKAADLETCRNAKAGDDLTRCDYSESTSLKDRNLAGAVLFKARLGGELGRADLSGADLSGAAVIGSLVIGAETRLAGANLSSLQSDGNNPLIAESANLQQTNFSQANLSGAKLAGADMSQAQLAHATMTGAELSGTQLANADMRNSNLSYANLAGAALTDTRLQEANLSDANLNDALLADADLQQANLAGAELGGSDLSGADLRGADLSAAKGSERAIIDSRTQFLSAICPDGVMVDGTQVTTCVGHGF
ncbi:pentapeptide repeat-containing protein [Methylomonas koyamae]|uniref:pentapeptide repeat-containing protein n=1 Tax=Methylomonas koyamae TaxID=702114 RepID=UPI00112BFA30|nr:pentapeptide repeat-containing protein [Methylomonas koyamae]TPQ27361.1 hypothetical protein C2U68_08750 [Methylomonas koyamae]